MQKAFSLAYVEEGAGHYQKGLSLLLFQMVELLKTFCVGIF